MCLSNFHGVSVVVKLEVMATNRRVYTFEEKKRFVNAVLKWRVENNFANRLGESSYAHHDFKAIIRIIKDAFGGVRFRYLGSIQ